jgi:hypothetical protein
MLNRLKEIGLDYRDRRIIFELYKDQETITTVGERKDQQ